MNGALGCILLFTPAAASPQTDDSLTADKLTIAVADGTDPLVEAGTLRVPKIRGGDPALVRWLAGYQGDVPVAT